MSFEALLGFISMSLFQPGISGIIKSELLISSGALPFFKEKRCCPLPMMGRVRLRVAPLPGSCSWVAPLQLCRMMLGRTSAFLIYACMSKTRLLGFKNPVYRQDTGFK